MTEPPCYSVLRYDQHLLIIIFPRHFGSFDGYDRFPVPMKHGSFSRCLGADLQHGDYMFFYYPSQYTSGS